MPRRTHKPTIEEFTGDRFPDLVTAQRAALKATAGDLATTIRELLAAGVLVQRNGQIIPNPDR